MFSPKEPTLVVSSGAIASLLHVSPMDEQRPPSHLDGMAQGSPFSGDLLALEPRTAEIQGAGHDEQSMLQYPRSSQDGITLQRSAGISAIAAGINDWASQRHRHGILQ
ncbi:hypothetical protein ETB97_002196 [Aspergillus alliaceus]|uniref:Uncharacterized protein n=1 Tax=Petromyces alliaceus TaxID=209559 RepID=A0A8H6E582_PETAA|nr:hypothetical protein ETB97_002196 [Aspergillus burnettii]